MTQEHIPVLIVGAGSRRSDPLTLTAPARHFLGAGEASSRSFVVSARA